ncbi:unnamed protein product [Chilo suppressalis]|uniref:Lipase n=1 Tax=Chilo suppressalis TaxID=168631 RepID=A0ABN8AWV0_CHISP|nr:unnamed protein product [Chilo suppressalis]
MKSCSCIILLVSLLLTVSAQVLKKAYATVPQLVESAGYPVEKHYAHTSDGYILQVYRIPHGKGTNQMDGEKKAIVLFHGLIGGCDNFIIMGPRKSLAYYLADAGYDVWLANLRGNFYTSHRTLTRKDPAFWKYSFDEHGKYDAPAIIDKILEVTGLSRVLYIGHSMGFTTLLTMLAQRPEYNDKLIAGVGLAPAAYLNNIQRFVHFVTNNIKLHKILHELDVGAIKIPRKYLKALSKYCTSEKNLDHCLNFVYSIVGDDYGQHDLNMSNVMIMRIQPASTQQILHYAKLAETGVLTSWEDGFEGRVKPYNLSNIRTPVSLWYGENDKLTATPEILRLARELNETGALHSVRPVPQWKKFNHLDFVYAKDVGKILNTPLVAHVKELFDQFDKRQVK